MEHLGPCLGRRRKDGAWIPDIKSSWLFCLVLTIKVEACPYRYCLLSSDFFYGFCMTSPRPSLSRSFTTVLILISLLLMPAPTHDATAHDLSLSIYHCSYTYLVHAWHFMYTCYLIPTRLHCCIIVRCCIDKQCKYRLFICLSADSHDWSGCCAASLDPSVLFKPFTTMEQATPPSPAGHILQSASHVVITSSTFIASQKNVTTMKEPHSAFASFANFKYLC